MRSNFAFAWVVSVFVFAVPVAAAVEAPANIQKARIELSESSPAATFERIGRSSTAEWVGWSIAAVPFAGEACCFSNNWKTRSCSLSEREQSWGTTSDEGEDPTSSELFVLLEVKNKMLGEVRLVSPTCLVKGGDRKVVWLGRVDGEASLALLGRLLEETKKEEPADRLLAAIAHHESPKADAILEKRAFDRYADEDTRKQAIFWAGNTRGESGYRLIDKVLDSEPDGDMRQHATFALTQNHSPRAVDRIKQVALEDRSGEVRAQALFWLAQTKAPGAGDWILARLDAEKNEDVRDQAVFALTQLPDGTDRLLEVLRSKRDPEVIRKALFWLGQSEDPRALDEIEKILER